MHSRLCKQYITFHFNFTEIKPLKLQKLQCTINFSFVTADSTGTATDSNKQWWTWTYVLMMWTDVSIESLWCVTMPQCWSNEYESLTSCYDTFITKWLANPVFQIQCFKLNQWFNLRDYQICHSVPRLRLRLTRRGLRLCLHLYKRSHLTIINHQLKWWPKP